MIVLRKNWCGVKGGVLMEGGASVDETSVAYAVPFLFLGLVQVAGYGQDGWKTGLVVQETGGTALSSEYELL